MTPQSRSPRCTRWRRRVATVSVGFLATGAISCGDPSDQVETGQRNTSTVCAADGSNCGLGEPHAGVATRVEPFMATPGDWVVLRKEVVDRSASGLSWCANSPEIYLGWESPTDRMPRYQLSGFSESSGHPEEADFKEVDTTVFRELGCTVSDSVMAQIPPVVEPGPILICNSSEYCAPMEIRSPGATGSGG